VLACGITWLLALPATLTFSRGGAPSPLEVAGAGLSAFGPSFAALVFSFREGSTREVFTRFRTAPGWLGWAFLALLTPIALRLLAALVSALFGFELSQWYYAPELATQQAALFVFPLAEEFGWRGFAYPRLRDRFGLVKGSLILGVMWSLWHLGYIVDPRTGELDWLRQLESLVSLPLYSVIMTWFFERSRRSMAVAIGFHMAAHLNHVELAPLSEAGFHLTHLVVVAIAAAFVAWRLERNPPAVQHPVGQAA
jgi:membrane protease YdiL (CAAX protease family)